MSPISKFAVFLVLAGVLAGLFAFVPGNRQRGIPSEKIETQPAKTQTPMQRLWRKVSGGENKVGAANGSVATGKNIFSSNVKVPAIRGVNNYGWVQLPRGTRVDFVRDIGDSLWVRWDGTTVKVPQDAAANGAVVIR